MAPMAATRHQSEAPLASTTSAQVRLSENGRVITRKKVSEVSMVGSRDRQTEFVHLVNVSGACLNEEGGHHTKKRGALGCLCCVLTPPLLVRTA